MKHLRYLLMAALVAMPLTACDEDTDTVAPDPVITGTVTGSVTAEGDALAGVTVTLVGAVPQSASTTAAGTYTFANVVAGSYGVSISAPASLDVVFPQTALTTTITTAGEIQTVDFAGSYIRTASVVGTVTAGGPLAGVSVTITGDDGSFQETTDLGGGFAFGGLRAGEYTVTIAGYPADALFATTSIDVEVTSGGSANASFAGALVELGSISGAVTVDGVGAVGVVVTLGGAGAMATQTGANGAYTFMDLAPGAYTVTITAPAETTFDDLMQAKTLVAGENATLSFAGRGPGEPASLSIQSITTGVGVPINPAAVMGQIEVAMNLSRGDRGLDKVDVLIGGEVVWSQDLDDAAPAGAEAVANDEVIVANVLTNQLRMGSAGVWVPTIFNGANTIQAVLYEEGDLPVPTIEVPVVMANPDLLMTSDGALIVGTTTRLNPGFASDVATGGQTWNTGGIMYDGPVYISFSTTAQAARWTASTCGLGTAAATGTPATGIVLSNTWTCAGVEGANATPGVTLPAFTGPALGPDGTAVGLPGAWSALGAEFMLPNMAGVDESRWFVLTPGPAGTTAPSTFDVDNLGPTVSMATVAYSAIWDEWWINGGMDLTTFITLVDGGVGPANGTKATLARDEAIVCGAVVTNADLSETNLSTLPDAHRICGYGEDLLENGPQNAPVSNWFGKDSQAPAVYMLTKSPLADALTACTDPALDPFMNDVDNIFMIGSVFPVLVPIAGFGVEAIDDRAGFHKDDLLGPTGVGTGTGPVVQTVKRYYPDPVTDATLMSTATGPTWLKLVMANNHVRSSVFGGAETCMPHWVGALNEPGSFLWSATATDMAGNSASVSQDWAVDEINVPVHNTMVAGALQYMPGTPGPFQFWGSDDFEVAAIQISMTYPTDIGHDGAAEIFELVYPPVPVDAAQTVWDLGFDKDVLTGTTYNADLLGQGIIGRVDFTTATGVTVANFNTIDGADLDAAMESDDFLPMFATGWIASDIVGNGPSVGTTTVALPGADFGGWVPATGTPAPWPAPGVGTIIEEWKLWDEGVPATAEPVDMVAQHKAPNSVFNPYFDAVALVHNDGAGNLTVCGPMATVTQQDQGFNRFYRYQMTTADLAAMPAACTGAVALDSFHAAGVKLSATGAALLVTDPGVSIIHP